MSRSRRILNMLSESVNSTESDSSISNIPLKTPDECVNAVTIIQQHESPLPPGAEKISLSEELSGIWEEMDQSDDSKENTLSPLRVSSIHSIQDADSEKLTPFSLDATSSYESSPLFTIEDLESLTPGRSTPAKSTLTVPTPMPSPLNQHLPCRNLFCPDHDVGSSVDSSSLRSTNLPSNSLSSAQTITPKTTKKRKTRRQNEWSEVKRKCLKNLGKTYVTKRGITVDQKTMRPPCTCRFKCADKITHQQRVALFTKFWELGDRAKQWSYVVTNCEKKKKKRCLNQETPNERKYTYKYYLPLASGLENESCEKLQVCQTMFLNTLSVTTRLLKTAWKKYDGSVTVEDDRRGRHVHHKRVITDAMVQSVCDHVRAFAPVESHYIRKNSKKMYLDGDLSIAKMFHLYNEWFDPEKYTSKAEKERQYRDIVNDNFNLGFHIPKKDQCDDCHIFRAKKDPTEEEKNIFEQHQNNKKVARSLKNLDKNAAVESDGKVVTAVFDFEKVLTCPHGNISIFYYKRKLSCFNFTVYDMGNKKAVCYMWDESIAKRGANEVSSCLLDFVKTNVERGVKEFRFWSDNCAGQNRNRFVFSSYVYAAKKFNISITHRFMQKGHTQNEGDSVHSVIERASQKKNIYTPDEWRILVRWAKAEGEAYEVRSVSQDDIFDFKSQVNNKVWLKNIKGAKIAWSNVREVHTNSCDPNKLFYKYDQTQPEYEILVIRGNTRHSVQTELKKAYLEPIKLPVAKYKDLISMCQSKVIPSEYSPYFTSLPHHITVDNSENSDDDCSD